MEFILKKIVGSLLLPLPISILCIVIGLAVILLSRYRRTGGLLIAIGTAVLLLFSTSFIAIALLTPLESKYQPLTKIPTTISMIVVLGGGVGGNPNYPPNTRLSSASLSRLVEAIRLFRYYQAAHRPVTLILSGGRVFGSARAANKMQNTALMLGVKPSKFILENGSKDTAEEAKYLQKIIHDKPFILVTSAFHMERAMALFTKLGMHPVAAPTQYLSRTSRYRISRYFPSASNLLNSDIAIHEYFGLLWAKINNKI